MSIDKSSIDKRMPLMPIQSGNKVSTQYTQRNKVLIYAMMYLQEHLKKLAPEFEKKWAKTVGPELAKKWVMRWAQTLTRQLPLEIAEEEEAWTRQLILEPKTEIAKSEQKFNQAEAQAAIKKRIWARIKKHAQFAIEAMAQKWAENREELWAQEWKSEMEPALSTGHSANTTCSR